MSDCERCSNYVFDEQFGEFFCEAPFDEDELAREAENTIGRTAKKRVCPYYVEDGEYKTVNKQI